MRNGVIEREVIEEGGVIEREVIGEGWGHCGGDRGMGSLRGR